MTKEDYERKLELHDWYYYMTDDSKAYNAGLKSWNSLTYHAALDKELNAMLEYKAEQMTRLLMG